MGKKYFLDGKWDLKFTLLNDEVVTTQVQVPGNVEPELVRLGLIDDYMPADSERATDEFAVVDDWTYTTVFDAPYTEENHKVQLVFEGIDTIAEVYLNNELICNCENMHMDYKIDVTDELKEKNNLLKVVIRSSDLWTREHCHDMFSMANAQNSYYDSRSYLRKARHQWGWDNAPRLLTSGIIRSVYLEVLPPCRFEEVYLYTMTMNEKEVRMVAQWIYKTDKKCLTNHKIRLTLLDGDEVVHQEIKDVWGTQGGFRYCLPREKVRLWWPAGFGEAALYTVRLEMLEFDNVLAVYEDTFGIRTLRLERTEEVSENDDGEFVFYVNGEKVFIRGTNWKPLDPLVSVADRKTKELRALEEVKKLNCNMVRIWGGGIYEGKEFFDYCDRNGIMVWQDFMFACEIPPIDEEYCNLVAEEAKQVIKKLRNHPSLAIWCGDNESDEGMLWASRYSTLRPSHSLISRKILKDAVLHHDPYRCYIESSPYASDRNYTERNTRVMHFQPETHLYPNALQFSEALRTCKSLFIGETGPIIVNAISSGDRMYEREKVRAERLWDAEPMYNNQTHQSDGYFVAWRRTGKEVCEAYYGRDFSFAEWKDYTLAINVVCAELFKDVIEYCRVKRWSKTGVLWWSLMDMWPMLFNYSVIDSDGNRKLPYYWIRQSQQEFALCGVRVEQAGELVLYAANDTLKDYTTEYKVIAYDVDGNSRMIASGICKQSRNSASMIQRIAESEQPEMWIIHWENDGKQYTNHVFTQKVSFDVMKLWVKIIGEESGFVEEILELDENVWRKQ